MPDETHPDSLAQQARFVFNGTVESVHESRLPDVVPSSDRSCVVRVNSVLQSPQSLAQAAGQEVTIQFSESPGLSAGDSAVFFTNPMAYGDTVAVQAVGHQAMPAVLAALSRRPEDPVRTLVNRDRQARMEAAELVIRGRVTAVRLPDPSPESAVSSRRDEHDPQWRDAVVQVLATEKGTASGPEIVVRFSGSRDVAWRDWPKFQAGDEGRFILNRWQVADGAAEVAVADGTSLYAAPGRYDFQPVEELIAEVLAAVGPTP